MKKVHCFFFKINYIHGQINYAMKWFPLIFFFFFLIGKSGFGQTESCHKSTEGKDFWFGFMENRNYQAGHFTEITLTSVNICKYDIFIGKSALPYTSGILIPNFPTQITIPWTFIEPRGSENIENKAIHLVSDNPLNVYAFSWSPNSSDVAVIYPTVSLGSEYYAMCYDPHLSSVNVITGDAQGKNSEFMVVASDNNTLVTITPTRVTDHLRPANKPFTITLNKGELYQVQSENLPNTGDANGQGDLTGSYITSNKPVAVFSGSYATTVPLSSNDAYDHLYEQLPPVQTWGRKFIAVPLMSRLKDTYRILASESQTTVRIGNQTLVKLNKGEFYEFMLNSTEASMIESDKPVLLAQYSNSNNVDRPPGVPAANWDGDPFMIIVSPVNQTRERVAFVAYESAQIRRYFINVVVKDDVAGKINLDGRPVIFQSLAGGIGYSYAQLEISKGKHLIESTEPGKGFIAYVYGFGGYESYGYGVGFNLDLILDLGSNINANGKKMLVRCDGAEPLTLNAGNGFDSYLWSTGETTSTIKVSNAGWYKVKVSSSSGCVLRDSVELQVNKPVVGLGSDTTICNPRTFVLDAGAHEQFASFLWTTPQDTQKGQKVIVSKAGIYAVEATNKYGCIARDTIKVSFTDHPKINFSGLETLVCGKKSAILDVTADKGLFTVQRMSDNFIFSNLNVAVPDYGTYNLKIKATDQFSCYSDSVIKFGFQKTPSVDFSIDSTTCYKYNLNVKYSGDAGIGSDFIWIFGGDTIKHGIGADSNVIPLGINRSTRNLKLKVTDQGCSNDKTLHDIKVIPNLQMSVLDSLGCEPFTAKFEASNTETVTYDWDFGDGIVLSGSTADPSHTYQNDGYYPVKLKVTTNKGCTNEVKIDSLVHVAPIPTVGFTPFSSECLEKGDHKISYSGSGDPLDRYIWDLSKFDSEEVIQNPNETQGPLVFNLKNKPQTNIGLKVISKYGCQSANTTVVVKRKPDFSIHVSSNTGCIPFEPLFTGTIGDPVDQVNYSWDFGDGAHGTGAQVKHLYEVPDKRYDVVLTALSSITGCSDTISRQDFIRSYPKPKAAFDMDHKIVYIDLPTVHFTNLSDGANAYLWDFGEGASSDQKDPSHDYKQAGYRTILMEVLNEFGCSDTVSHRLLVAYDRIFPPTGFSPNAPNVVDREFKLGSEAIATAGYHFTILSRWNDIVFEARDEIKGWNGKMPNGSFAPAGTYVWILYFKDFLGRKHRQTGMVTLLY